MKKIIRAAAITGIGLVAGIAVGAGPAQAATATGGHTPGAQTQAHWNDDSDTVGYYRSLRTCERVGRIGEFRDRWDDYDCTRVRWGFHRGAWALTVDYGWDGDGDWNGHHGGWNGHHGGWNGHRGGWNNDGGFSDGRAVAFPIRPAA
ncbi:hypothetical protein ACQP2F_17130 [Actinoplanes sp. CA-030573]|uniref:hypothetical protein n=1 Tax=Actinoplanes sp. CA-030573 TaxID=3239898 RepID=UPI003D91C110